MQFIQLAVLPKQRFSISLDNTLYDIALIETNGCMSANITRGGEPTAVVSGFRCVAGQLIIPEDREAGLGNFFFLTNAGDLPFWDQFASTQVFGYASPADLAAVRG